MTVALIEVGPGTVRGPGVISPPHAEAAVECIDDGFALVADDPVVVDELWSEVLRSAAGDDCDASVLVCPTWWSTAQRDRVRAAAVAAGLADVVMLHRADALSADLQDRSWAVVEIAGELLLVSRSGADPVAIVRSELVTDLDNDVAAVADAIANVGEVIVDAPPGVCRAGELGLAIAERLRHRGIAVTVVDRVASAPAAYPQPPPPEPVRARTSRSGKTAVCAGLAVAAVFAGYAVTQKPGREEPTVTLVEGYVAMLVPAAWTAERRTADAGSARVQIVSPEDPGVALQLTQSVIPPGAAPEVADTLRRLLDDQPAGIFVDFNPRDRIAGREVITYREVRAQRQVTWVVLVDRSVRIAIGCQSAPERPDAVRAACEVAVRSAHAVR